MKTKHNQNCKRAFKNYDKSCLRCIELSNGATPREGWNDCKKKQDNLIETYRKNHSCIESNCMYVCTWGQY